MFKSKEKIQKTSPQKGTRFICATLVEQKLHLIFITEKPARLTSDFSLQLRRRPEKLCLPFPTIPASLYGVSFFFFSIITFIYNIIRLIIILSGFKIKSRAFRKIFCLICHTLYWWGICPPRRTKTDGSNVLTGITGALPSKPPNSTKSPVFFTWCWNNPNCRSLFIYNALSHFICNDCRYCFLCCISGNSYHIKTYRAYTCHCF